MGIFKQFLSSELVTLSSWTWSENKACICQPFKYVTSQLWIHVWNAHRNSFYIFRQRGNLHFKTCSIISTKCNIFHDTIFICSKNNHIFHNPVLELKYLPQLVNVFVLYSSQAIFNYKWLILLNCITRNSIISVYQGVCKFENLRFSL